MALSLLAVAAAASYSGAVVWATLNKYKLDQLYTYHPLAASAFLVFAVTGIVTAQNAKGANHKARITYHGYWQVAATLTALATNTIIYLHKESKGKPHLASWHGKAGAATTGLWLVVQMFGGLAWYQPALISKLMPLNKAYIQHGVFGVLAFSVLMTTHALALNGSYQGFKKGTREWQILAGLLGVVAVSVVLKTGRLMGRAQKAFLGGSKQASAKAQ